MYIFFFQDLIRKVYGLYNKNVLGLREKLETSGMYKTLEELSQTFYLVYMCSTVRNLGLQHNKGTYIFFKVFNFVIGNNF